MYGWQLRYVNPHAYPGEPPRHRRGDRDSPRATAHPRAPAARDRDAQRRRDLRHAQRRDLSEARRLPPRRLAALGRDPDVERHVLGGRQLHPPLVQTATRRLRACGSRHRRRDGRAPAVLRPLAGRSVRPERSPRRAAGRPRRPERPLLGAHQGDRQRRGPAHPRRLSPARLEVPDRHHDVPGRRSRAGTTTRSPTLATARPSASSTASAAARSCSGTPPRCSASTSRTRPMPRPRTRASPSASTCKKG